MNASSVTNRETVNPIPARAPSPKTVLIVVRRGSTPSLSLTPIHVNAVTPRGFPTIKPTATPRATGLVICISLFERTACIIADDRVTEAIGQPALDELCNSLTARLSTGEPAGALCETIAEVAEALAPALPPAADDTNELRNALIIVD